MKKILLLGLMICMMGACGQKEETVEVSYQVERVRTDDGMYQDPDETEDADQATAASQEPKYEILSVYREDAFRSLLEGEETAVIVLYGQGGEGGYVTSDSDDPEVINGFIEAFRDLKIKEIITDPDRMEYVADGGEDIVLGLYDGSQVNITLDGQNRIHADGVVYIIENNSKLIECCLMMADVAYMNQFGGPWDSYIAILHGGVGEKTFETYVYEVKTGYEYVNVESTTVSYGSTQWDHVVKKCGRVSTKEEVVDKAEAHGADGFVTFPGDNNAHPIDDFLNL